MTYEEFRTSLAFDDPPPDMPPLVAALWHLDKDDWHAAHEIAQSIESREAAWVHAHLHRVEGDIWNADYWYRRADRTRPEASLEDERAAIVKALLKD
jgi:hypothetical protein